MDNNFTNLELEFLKEDIKDSEYTTFKKSFAHINEENRSPIVKAWRSIWNRRTASIGNSKVITLKSKV